MAVQLPPNIALPITPIANTEDELLEWAKTMAANTEATNQELVAAIQYLSRRIETLEALH